MKSLEELLPLLSALAADRDTRRSLSSLAAEAETSPSYFQRFFSRLTGESPKQYTRRLQLESAAARLLTSSAKIVDIAFECGFDSHEGFTRAFTSHFGHSPRTFRAQWTTTAAPHREAVARLIEHVGPCLHLFRVEIDPPAPTGHKKDTTMTYDITSVSISSGHINNGPQGVGDGALAPEVGSPARDDATGVHRTGMKVSSRNLGHGFEVVGTVPSPLKSPPQQVTTPALSTAHV